MDIVKAKTFLEDNGYVVVRRSEPGWEEKAFKLSEEYIAIRLAGGQPSLIKPKLLCDLIGIDRHTLSRNLKRPDCPQTEQKPRCAWSISLDSACPA